MADRRALATRRSARRSVAKGAMRSTATSSCVYALAARYAHPAPTHVAIARFPSRPRHPCGQRRPELPFSTLGPHRRVTPSGVILVAGKHIRTSDWALVDGMSAALSAHTGLVSRKALSSVPLELAVVDMAGTTVREDGLVERSMRRSLERVAGHVPADFEERFRTSRGAAKADMCRNLLGGDQVAASRALAVFDEEMHSAVDRGELVPLPGATDALLQLADLGVKVCLTSGFSRALCDHLLDVLAWRPTVDLVLSAEEVGRGRPWPDLILTAVLRLKVESVRHVATVGDTVNDVLAGHRAGASVVAGVLTGAHSGAELAAGPLTHLVSDIGAFVAVIAHMSANPRQTGESHQPAVLEVRSSQC